MNYQYYNANPLGRRVNDCTIRAISLATNRSWDQTYEELSKFAQAQGMMLDEVNHIDQYLDRKFEKVYSGNSINRLTVRDFCLKFTQGTFLITMNGHITCAKDGCVYDTFDPGNKIVWDAYRVDEERTCK